MLKQIDKAKDAWRKAHPNSHETPWDTCALGKHDPKEKTYWLNPCHQQHINYGSVTDADLQDWIDGKPGTIIRSQEHWDELLYMISMNAWSIGYYLEHFNLHPIEHLLTPGWTCQGRTGQGFPKRMLLPQRKNEWYRRISPEMVKAVESHIKWVIKDDFESQSFSHPDLTAVRLRREAHEEIYGFLFCLKQFGLEAFPHGASNIPARRENFAWWPNLLEPETRWQMLMEAGLGYEPWMKNKKSTYSLSTKDETPW